MLMSWMAISENNSSSAELNAKSLETQIISQKYEQNIAKITVDLHNKVSEKYGRVRCINIFADYGFCVFHLC
jgi:ABC-type phosphate/phosphonate transport system substrate-binding protein